MTSDSSQSHSSFSHFLYVVFDLVAQATAGPLITLASDAVARRVFSDAVFAPGSQLSQHPADFVLLKVGTIDTSTGVISALPHQPLVTAHELVELAARMQEASANG